LNQTSVKSSYEDVVTYRAISNRLLVILFLYSISQYLDNKRLRLEKLEESTIVYCN